MILDEINATIEFNIEGKVLDGSKMPRENNFIIPNDKYFVLNGKNFELTYSQQSVTIDEYLSVGTAHVCHVINSDENGYFLARLIFFGGNLLTLNDIHVLVDSSANLFKRNKQIVIDHSHFFINGEKYFIIKTSCSENEDAETVADFAFSIITEEKNVDVKKIESIDGVYYKATKSYKRINNVPQANYRMVKGTFSFDSQRTIVSILTQEQLNAIRKNKSTYLDAWREYTKERGKNILALARKFDKATYSRIEKTDNGYKLFLDKVVDIPLNYEVQLFPHNSIGPYFLNNRECDWNDYLSGRKEQRKNHKRNNKDDSGFEDEIEAEVLEIRDNIITVELKKDVKTIPDKGFITISTLPEEKQIERQVKAWELINTGNCGIQHLGLLLEDGASIPVGQKKRCSKKISQHTLKKVFGDNPPTLKQREAIEIALQTPDIALIQGPPGTGKTTVIAAILEMLNEQQDKKDICAGRVLATAYQHDAVTNMIGRLSVNSLPTPKFGKRKGEEDNKENIKLWIDNVINRLEANDIFFKPGSEIVDFSARYAEYNYKPSEETEKKLLETIIRLSQITSEISSTAREYLLHLPKEGIGINNREDLLRCIRAIRITRDSFIDDGPQRIMDLVAQLDNINFFSKDNSNIRNFLIKLYKHSSDIIDNDLFKKMVDIKEQLLHKFSHKPLYVKYEIKPEIIELCAKVEKCYEASLPKRDKKQEILMDWAGILEINPQVLEKAIRDCSYVYAATAQQSDSSYMDLEKQSLDRSDKSYYFYDTVIIDEAARAAPPDLLIPMCKAIKRIILVGDHRQLPQLVDDDICEKLEKKQVVKDKSELASLSLFEKLFERMKSLELNDGIKRTVTLDQQYRTHPILGTFASKEFYDKYGEHYDSPIPAEKFSQSLSGIENKAAVWLNVDESKETEKRSGSSYVRSPEAKIIADRIEGWSNSEEGKNYSYGVITFYKAQEKLIRQEINKRKIHLPSNKLKIGTVDSFQGMEFDIVFLSVVRSNKSNNYGFLQSVNRLCVSLTRQKKVLVVVGDKAFCSSEVARQENCIPALAHFADLCDNSEFGVSI